MPFKNIVKRRKYHREYQRKRYPTQYAKRKEYFKKWRKDNPDKVAANWRKAKYGMTQKQYENMLKKQKYKCAICKSSDPGWKNRWHVDHNHSCCSNRSRKTCGKCTRALLCQTCNLALGLLKENPALIKSMLNYIKRFSK